MRLIMLIAAFSLLTLAPAYARGATVSLTHSQVSNTCGSGLGSGGGVTGCTKKCGDKFCGYFCNNKTGKCEGFTIGMVKPPQQPAELDAPPASLVTQLQGTPAPAPIKKIVP